MTPGDCVGTMPGCAGPLAERAGSRWASTPFFHRLSMSYLTTTLGSTRLFTLFHRPYYCSLFFIT